MCLPLATMAQEKQMVVYRDGRTPLRIDVALVDSITFEDAVEEHEYVDLGLSVLWATCNIGAATPEEYGNYFAWGETATKDSYTEENYVYAENGAYKDLPKDIAGTEYDAATAIWKGEWRMPNINEVEELAKNCTWTWTAQKEVNGYRIVGPSGKEIFLPAAGQWRNAPINVGSTGYYWTSSLSDEYSSATYNLNFTGFSGRWSANRAYGFCIRAVCNK